MFWDYFCLTEHMQGIATPHIFKRRHNAAYEQPK